MHAAEAAGREHANAGPTRQQRRGRNSRRAIAGARGGRREVAHAAFGYLGPRCDALQLGVSEADDAFTADHADGRRDATFFTHDCLELARQGQVVRAGQPVRDQRAFEGDHRTAPRQRLSDLGSQSDRGTTRRHRSESRGSVIPAFGVDQVQHQRRPAEVDRAQSFG